MASGDLALLKRWTENRDAEAFRELATRYAGVVYGTCRRVLGNAADAEDTAQECLLTLAKASAPPQRNLGAWLHRVAVNRARDRVKQDRRRREREMRYVREQSTTVQAEWRDIEAYVDEAIAALPGEFKEAIVGHFLQGRSHAEVAEELGVSRSTVTYRVGKGVELIRKDLRHRGIQIAAPALTALLTANMAEAAPASLAAAVGKMALSGGATGGEMRIPRRAAHRQEYGDCAGGPRKRPSPVSSTGNGSTARRCRRRHTSDERRHSPGEVT